MPKTAWRLKAVLPVAGLLLLGLLAFEAATFQMEAHAKYRILAVAAAGAVAICATVLAVLAVLVNRPLVELKEKIARVRAGDLTVNVTFGGRNDELGELGRNFNEMMRQVRAGREALERSHRDQMSLAEHLATVGELAAGLAHEIRNPLAGIAGVIEIIGSELPASSPNREVLQEVRQEIQRIRDILTDLLDYARPKPPVIRPADLNATAEQAVALARQQIMTRPITIDFVPLPGLPPVAHDAAQIQQVLLNLLLNAIQAIPASGQIRLELAARDDFAIIRVSDNGRGIAPEHLPNIFRPFFTTKGKGTGLGLSLARRIVEDHGGRIEVTSQPGKGTEFILWVPVAKTVPDIQRHSSSVLG